MSVVKGISGQRFGFVRRNDIRIVSINDGQDSADDGTTDRQVINIVCRQGNITSGCGAPGFCVL